MQAVFFGKLLLNTSVITWIILVLVKNAFIFTFQVDDNLMYYYSYYYQYHFYYYIITPLIVTSILWMRRLMLKEVSGKATQWGHLRTNKNPELWLRNPFSLLYLADTLPSCGLPDFFPFFPFSPFFFVFIKFTLGCTGCVAGRHTEVQDRSVALEELANVWFRQEDASRLLVCVLVGPPLLRCLPWSSKSDASSELCRS